MFLLPLFAKIFFSRKISELTVRISSAQVSLINVCAGLASSYSYLAKVFIFLPGRVTQSVTCLPTDACLTAIPGVASSIPARSHTFVEIDHEIISTVILLPSADSFKKGCCQLLLHFSRSVKAVT